MDDQIESRIQKLVDRLSEQTPKDLNKIHNTISALREELALLEDQAASREALVAKFEEAYAKLTSPANRVATLCRLSEDGQAVVVLGDTEYVVQVDPSLDLNTLISGTRVRLNEAYAVVGLAHESSVGSVVKVSDVLADGRLRIGGETGGSGGKLIERSAGLAEATIRGGDEVRLDASGRIAIEHFGHEAAKDYFIEEVPPTPWSAIGGQEAAIELIRETIELPLLHPEIYEKFDKKPIKGLLLYGPPGCGKTLIGKATAYNLAKEYSERTGKDVKECFMHISGPKVLNMWLGETERMIREIFAAARAKAKEGQLVVIFIDEAESLLRTRGNNRWLNISNTVVPQFCAEIDGLVALENVVLIITSNRPDFIDPAILRPERIDRKIKVIRPTKDAARQILGIYLHDRLPIDPTWIEENDGEACARKALIETALAKLWSKSKQAEFLKVQKLNGSSEILYWKDFVSGALIKSVVDRAKDHAMRRAISEPGVDHGVSGSDLEEAIAAEFGENEIFPKSDAAEDWLKLLDLEPEDVAAVFPVRQRPGEKFSAKVVI